MSPDVFLEFNGGYLKPLKPEDVHQGYVSGLNDPEVNRFLEVRRTVQTERTVIKFVLDNQRADDAVLFGVWKDGDRFHCGTIRLHCINHSHQFAHIGICLFDKTVWGKKIGSAAVAAITKWAFNTLKLRTVEAGVYESNIASQKVFFAAGYKWTADINNRYKLEDKYIVVKVFVANNSSAIASSEPTERPDKNE